MNILLYEQGIKILMKIEEAGFEAYIAGGAVRDYILNKTPNDVDIASNAPQAELKKIFKKTIPVGKNEQTVLVFLDSSPFEVTQFKGSSWKEDLAARDFTCNAMALNSSWEVLDPYAGRKDIFSGKLRAAENPFKMFRADPVRLIRMIRFQIAMQLQPDPGLLKAFYACSTLVKNAAPERIFQELNKLRDPVNENRGWPELIELLNHLPLPVLTCQELKNELSASSPKVSRASWWTILLFNAEENESFLKYIPGDLNKHRRKVELAIKSFPWTNRELYDFGGEVLESARLILSLLKIEHEDFIRRYDELPIHQRRDLAVSGNDFTHLDSKTIGEVLMFLENAVLASKAENQRSALLSYLEKEYK